MKKYFHELTWKEIKETLSDKTIAWVVENYHQPEWCSYPLALAGLMGCWKLVIEQDVKDESSCNGCEFLEKERKALKEL